MLAEETPIDLLIIGGGINGAGIAADAAGRGLSVWLCDQYDLAGGTSWASTKLIHGGLRYLEQGEWRLVYKALKERALLLRNAPHLIRPLELVVPLAPPMTQRSPCLIRAGLWLYDHLVWQSGLPRSEALSLHQHAHGQVLHSTFHHGFRFFDCSVDDSRLVIHNTLLARQKGATILPRTALIQAHREANLWKVILQETQYQQRITVTCRALVNATGPWVESTLQRLNLFSPYHLRLVKGSHIVVPRLYAGEHAYLLQNNDHRVVFTIPFHDRFTLIGTTEIAYTGNPGQAKIDNEEIEYLCDTVNQYFKRPISKRNVVWSFAGVRPLVDTPGINASALSRDYELYLDQGDTHALAAPALTVYGGKLTTYRTLANQALEQLRPFFPTMGLSWTAEQTLPGGDLIHGDLSRFLQLLQAEYPWLPRHITYRYASSYGSYARKILAGSLCLDDLGEYFEAGLYAREVQYLMQQEWARTSEDILWRRTKLGLDFSKAGWDRLNNWLNSY